MPTMLTTKQAAALLRVSTATVARMYHREELRGHKKSNPRNTPLLIEEASVEELIKARQQP